MVLLLIIIFAFAGGAYFFLKANPPLEVNTIGTTGDNHSVVVGMGNAGCRDIQIEAVAVNQYEEPEDTQIQLSNSLQGYVLTDDFQSKEAEQFRFVEVDQATLKPGTSLSDTLEKSQDGKVSEDDEIYGLSILHHEEIRTVHIKYSYFGINLFEEVEIPPTLN